MFSISGDYSNFDSISNSYYNHNNSNTSKVQFNNKYSVNNNNNNLPNSNNYPTFNPFHNINNIISLKNNSNIHNVEHFDPSSLTNLNTMIGNVLTSNSININDINTKNIKLERISKSDPSKNIDIDSVNNIISTKGSIDNLSSSILNVNKIDSSTDTIEINKNIKILGNIDYSGTLHNNSNQLFFAWSVSKSWPSGLGPYSTKKDKTIELYNNYPANDAGNYHTFITSFSAVHSNTSENVQHPIVNIIRDGGNYFVRIQPIEHYISSITVYGLSIKIDKK